MTEPFLPELRDGPPWVMEEMIAAEPDLARPILGATPMITALADAVRQGAHGGRRISVVGCGTSEHAAMAVATLLDRALVEGGGAPGTVVSRQAFEAALEPWPDGLVIAISHEGETDATIAAMTAAHRLGARTALITAAGSAPAAHEAELVLETPLLDRSWCHTVGYVSPVLAGAAVAAAVRGGALDADAVTAYLRAGLASRVEIADVAGHLGRIDRLVASGSGLDHGSARELALKIEEGVRMPAVGRELETELHGHFVSADAGSALVGFATDPDHAGPRLARTRQGLAAGRRLGMPTIAVVGLGLAGEFPQDVASAGVIELPEPAGVPGDLAAVAGSAMALQLLTLALVMRAGTNPDRIGRETDAQREAAALVSASFEV